MGTKIPSKIAKLYRKIFPANGITLGEPRRYTAGDDTRMINWKASAKTGDIFVDSIVSDHGKDIIFVLDVSGSMRFSSKAQPKLLLAKDIISQISRLAEANHDKAGLVLFSDKIEKYLFPSSRTGILQHAINKIVQNEKKFRTSLLEVLKIISKSVKKRSTIIILCDVFALADKRKTVLSHLHALGLKHEIIMLPMSDDNDIWRAKMGKIVIEDAETGEILEIDTNNASLMDKILEKYQIYKNLIFRDIGAIGIKIFEINTKLTAENFLSDFFLKMSHHSFF